MLKSLILATVFVGGVANAKVSGSVTIVTKPAKPAVDASYYYANKCVQSAKNAVYEQGAKPTYTEIVYSNGVYSAVYVEYVNSYCGDYGCAKVKKNYTFKCTYGVY